MPKTYKDFCRRASPIERTSHLAQPGDVIFTGSGVVRVSGEIVAMRRKVGAR